MCEMSEQTTWLVFALLAGLLVLVSVVPLRPSAYRKYRKWRGGHWYYVLTPLDLSVAERRWVRKLRHHHFVLTEEYYE